MLLLTAATPMDARCAGIPPVPHTGMTCEKGGLLRFTQGASRE